MTEKKDDGKAHRPTLPGWLVVFMQVAGVVLLLAGPALHALSIAPTSAGYLMGGGVALLIFASLDRLESFTAWGVSAKLREAQAAASEAAASAEEVRALALAVVRLALGLAKGGGRYDGGRLNQRATRAEAIRILTAFGATAEERKRAFETWSAITLHDYAFDATSAIWDAVKIEDRQQIEAWREEIGRDFVLGRPSPSSTSIRQRAMSLGAMTEALEAALARLELAEQRIAEGEALDEMQP